MNLLTGDLVKNFESVLYHSQAYPFELNVIPLLAQWEKAKAKFIEAFGGKTIWKSREPVRINLTKEMKAEKFKSFLEELQNHGYCEDDDFNTFIVSNQDGFFENKVVEEWPEYHICKGAKLLKSFKKFNFDAENLRVMQDIASRYIQEDKIEGYLYLSVDPLDFLTVSDNNAKWTSCHSLDGDYRGGNLNYMVDETTLIAYVASDKKEQLRCFPRGLFWNNKKWRMLVHTNWKTNIYYNKQYPFTNDLLLELTHNAVVSVLSLTDMSKPECVGVRNLDYWCNSLVLKPDKTVRNIQDYIIYEADNGYLDLIRSQSYQPIMSYNLTAYKEWLKSRRHFLLGKKKQEKRLSELLTIHIGAPALCPCCGESHINSRSSFLCNDCICEHDADVDFYCYCAGCGGHIYEGEYCEMLNGEIYCERCLEEMKGIEEEEDTYA